MNCTSRITGTGEHMPHKVCDDCTQEREPRRERILRRMSWLQRTVRYEWHENGKLVLGPVFPATLLEWEIASD